MAQQIPLDSSVVTGHLAADHKTREVRPDLAYKRLAIVNVLFGGVPGEGPWALIDAGVPGSAAFIVGAAESRFKADHPPHAIIMTAWSLRPRRWPENTCGTLECPDLRAPVGTALPQRANLLSSP